MNSLPELSIETQKALSLAFMYVQGADEFATNARGFFDEALKAICNENKLPVNEVSDETLKKAQAQLNSLEMLAVGINSRIDSLMSSLSVMRSRTAAND